MNLADIDPGWFEVILTGFGLVISLFLGYQFGRRDPIEPCVTLNRHQALDLIRLYHKSVACDLMRCVRRSVQRIEERGREPTEEEFCEMCRRSPRSSGSAASFCRVFGCRGDAWTTP